MNDEKIFDIEVETDGTIYRGWVNPSEKLNDDGFPVSFHVVLNQVSLGYLSMNNGQWTVDEQRPAELVEAAGAQIAQHYKINELKRNA